MILSFSFRYSVLFKILAKLCPYSRSPGLEPSGFCSGGCRGDEMRLRGASDGSLLDDWGTATPSHFPHPYGGLPFSWHYVHRKCANEYNLNTLRLTYLSEWRPWIKISIIYTRNMYNHKPLDSYGLATLFRALYSSLPKLLFFKYRFRQISEGKN